MELAIDFAFASIVFLVGLTVFLILTASCLNTLALKIGGGGGYYLKAYTYPVKFLIEVSGTGKYVVRCVDGREGVHVYVIVIKGNTQDWSLYEGVTPFEVEASNEDWIVALSWAGYGVKEGVNRGLTIVTVRGVVPTSVQDPVLKPYIRIEGNHYDAYPPEVLVTAGGTVEKFSERVVEGYKPVKCSVVLVEGALIVETWYGG